MARLERELSRLLERRPVDLLTIGDLHPPIREKVLKEKLVIYSEGRSG